MGRTLEVPLFPLPGTVLFPAVTLPFYVFEPRYRAMLADALDGTGLIGIPMIEPDFEGAAGGDPPINPLFGVGSVEHYVTHEDGTSHILVQGRWKVRLAEDLAPAAGGYRRARVEIQDEHATSTEENQALRAELRMAAARVNRRTAGGDLRSVLEKLARDDGLDPGPVLHLLCALLVRQPGQRQALLECRGLRERARALRTVIEGARRRPRNDPTRSGPPRSGPSTDPAPKEAS